MELVRPFAKLGRNDAPLAGGKGASLGEMTTAGIPVPPGFVVLADTFEKFLTETDLHVEIDAILHKVNHQEIHTVERAAEDIKALILAAKMPADIAKEVEREFATLGAEYVAVRSSATAEDGAEHAWAGQLESYLNVTKNDVLEKVQHCWASLFTPRAIFYRFEKGLHGTKISVAVVVQKMVISEVSGIAFSVHPVTEDYNQLIIEAGFGLGEAIVSGQITPDSYVVEKSSLDGERERTTRNILDINVATQTRGLYKKAGGGNEWLDIPEPKASSQVLTGEQILELSTLILKIEDHYGFPCDIEWAFAEGKFYIVQSRPITTLQKKPVIENRGGINKLRQGDWQVNWDAKLSHLAISFTCSAYFDRLQKIFNVCISNLFCTFKKGRVVAYLETNDQEKFAAALLPKVSTVKQTEIWAENFKQSADIVTKKLSQATVDDFLKNTEVYADLFEEYGAWQIATKAVYGVLPLDVDPKIPHILEAARVYSEKFYKELGIFTQIIGEISKQEDGYTPEMISSLTGAELREYITNKTLPLVHDLQDRYDCSGLLLSKDQPDDILDCHQVQEIEQEWLSAFDGNEIKGNTAYTGKVTGRCHIIHDFKGADIEEGEILVTVMTDPNFVPLMKKAAAIVTDGGGMLCHAAIVSRELKKPCVVGTKVASKVLKDGDEVEVDADNGVVRILKKNSKSVISGVQTQDPLILLGAWNVLPLEAWRWFDIKAINHLFKLTGVKLRVFTYVKDELHYQCVFEREVNQLKELLEQNKDQKAKDKYIENIYSDFYKGSAELETYLNLIEKKNIDKLSTEELVTAIKQFGDLWTAITNQVWYALFIDMWYPLPEEQAVIKGVAAKARDQAGRLHERSNLTERQIYAEAAKRLSLDPKGINYLFPQEIIDALENQTSYANEIDARRTFCVTALLDSEYKIYSGNKAQDLFQKYEPPKEGTQTQNTLSGAIACKGKITGQARVIRHDDEFSDFKDGEILVALQTMVHYLPIMKKSAAILTEFGGMTSHAAIISRELNKPCIVSIKNLLASIGTGDQVEVDADNGVVKILNRVEKQSFRKAYTRNFSIIMQEVWFAANKEGLQQKLGFKEYPYDPPGIYFMKDGVEEVWENAKNYNWLIDKAVEKFQSDDKFFPAVYKQYFERLAEIEQWYKKEIKTVADLKIFIAKVNEAASDFLIIYVALLDDRVPKAYKDLANKFRDKDAFFADCNTAINKALKNIYPDLGYLTVYITQAELDKKIDKEELKKRDGGFALIPGVLMEVMSFEDLVKRLPEYTFTIDKGEGDTNGLKGQTAYKGKVSGRVRIVKRTDQVDQVADGEVIISPMTTPDMLPAMKKAAAFVTDEGGITCHAAIIARELKKPCVIGTKTASQLFKDGDMVEVDADNGVVRILKKLEPESSSDKFMKVLENHVLFPPVHNVSAFCMGPAGATSLTKYFRSALDLPALMILSEKVGVAYFLEDEFRNISKEFFMECWKNPNLEKESLAKLLLHREKIHAAYIKLNYQFVNNSDYQTLLPILDEIINLSKELNTMERATIIFDKALCKETLEELGVKLDQFDNIWNQATIPTFLSFDKRRKKYILELIAKETDWGNIAGLCQYFYANYDAVKDIAAVEIELKKEYGDINAEKAKQIIAADTTEDAQQLKTYNGWLKTCSKEQQQLANYIQLVMRLRDERKDEISKAITGAFRVGERMLSETGIDTKMLRYITSKELLRGKAYLENHREDILRRPKGFSILFFNNGDEEYSYDKAEEIIDQLAKKHLEQHAGGEIRGQSANKGLVRGRVRIVRDPNRTSLQKGDVLVTGMTRPEFVPLMKIASAIITDEGGITCHAAIVSRELNIPCIIGTKVSTQMLKDGDMVEVDADNGVVRILDKQSKFDPDDYIRLFRIEKLNFLMGELWLASYRKIGVIYTSKDNVQISYFPKSQLAETEKIGQDIYGNLKNYSEFKKEWQEYTQRASDFFKSLPNKLKENDVAQAIEILSESFDHYKKTEFIYVDVVTKLETEESNEVLGDFGNFKNSARSFLNQLWLGSDSNFSKLVKQLSKQFEIPAEDLFYYTPKEILNLFQGKVANQEHLTERRGDYVNTDRPIFGEEAKRILEQFYPKEKNITAFEGIIAQKGKACAPVWVVPQLFGDYDNLKSMISDMPKGHILLAETTSPDLILACKKASAIITDQGGLMSHAAVVARELKIPCIVGLKNAINFIKNDDLVEVDADNGIVKILK